MNTRPFSRSIAPAVLIGLLAFTLTVEWRAQTVSSRSVEQRRSRLAAVVAARQKNTGELQNRLAELRAQLEAATGGSALADLRRLAGELAPAVGTTAMQGPGVTVTLSDAPSRDRAANTEDSRIQDVDLQAVVNALWDGGAEAIAVNSERVVATTAIRNAGQAVLVNYHVLTSPYKVSAIGPSSMRTHFQSSEIARRLRGWAEIYGLGFRVDANDRLRIPSFGGSLRARYAQPIEKS